MTDDAITVDNTPARDAYEKPQPHVTTKDGVITVECAYSHDNGFVPITVGWVEDEWPDDDGKYVGCWVAHCGERAGSYGLFGHSRTSQLDAMADLVRSLAGLTSMFLKRETALHRVINDSPNALAKQLRDAERDLHSVQAYITTHVDGGSEEWDDGLQPLWRAEQAIEALAARLAENDPTQTPDSHP